MALLKDQGPLASWRGVQVGPHLQILRFTNRELGALLWSTYGPRRDRMSPSKMARTLGISLRTAHRRRQAGLEALDEMIRLDLMHLEAK